MSIYGLQEICHLLFRFRAPILIFRYRESGLGVGAAPNESDLERFGHGLGCKMTGAFCSSARAKPGVPSTATSSEPFFSLQL